MKVDFTNIQPTINPKLLSVKRVALLDGVGMIRNAKVHPDELLEERYDFGEIYDTRFANN